MQRRRRLPLAPISPILEKAGNGVLRFLKMPKRANLIERMKRLARDAAIETKRYWGGAALLLAACAPLPPAAVPSPGMQASPNFDERRPNFVIIHATGDDTAAGSMRTLTDPHSRVSAHYLIGRDGAVYQLVAERARAWHAGESRWGATTDLNSASLGIELDNNGNDPFPDVQIAALLTLLDSIQARYPIPAANYLGHADIAPRRKVDPSRHFPWATLARQGFGLWCDPPWTDPPPAADAALALRALGYDVSDLTSAIRAFKRHFVPEDAAPELTRRDLGVLFCLLAKSGQPIP